MGEHEVVETKPYKALVAAFVAALLYAAAEGSDVLPRWAELIIMALAVGGTTWLKKNPPVER